MLVFCVCEGYRTACEGKSALTAFSHLTLYILPKDGATLFWERHWGKGVAAKSYNDCGSFWSHVTSSHPLPTPESSTWVTWVSTYGACSVLTKEWDLVMVIDRSNGSSSVLCLLFITARRLFVSPPCNPIQAPPVSGAQLLDCHWLLC